MSLNWRRAGTVLGIVVAGLIVFVVSLLILVWLLLATERGTQLAISTAERYAPGELQVEHRAGNLISRLELDRVQYRDEGIDIDVSDVVLSWQPRKLLANTLHINEFSFSEMDASISLSEDEPEDARTDEFQLPEVDLPIDVVIDKLRLQDIQLALGDFTQHIELVELKAHSQGAHQRIDYFHAVTDIAEVELRGEVHTRDDYPLNVSFEAELALPDMHTLRVGATAAGDTTNLDVRVNTEGLADTQIQARLLDVLDVASLHWDADIELHDIRHEALVDSVNGMLISLRSQGNLETFELIVDGEVDSVEQGLVEFDGALRWSDMRLDIEHFEMTAEEMISSLAVEGYAMFGDILEIDIRGEAEAFGFTQNQFALTATGDQQGADQFELDLNLPQGNATVAGSVAWNPYLQWDVHANVSQLDFTELSEIFRGGLAIELTTRGSYDEQLQLYARIDEMRGELMDNTLNGQGEVEVVGDQFVARDLHLQWGEAQLRADGSYSPQGIDLDFLFSVPDISALVDGANGSVQARGEVTGDESAPKLEITLAAEALHWQLYRVDAISARLTADGTFQQLPQGTLEAEGINLDGQTIEQFAMRLRQEERHHIEADIGYGDLEARLALVGDWNYDDLRWHGEIRRLQLRYPDIGRWNLSQPAGLDVSPTQAQLRDFCLLIATRESEICAEAEWHQVDERLSLELAAESIPYQMFSPWIPDDIQVLGEFSFRADVQQQGEDLNIDSRLTITDTSVRVPAQELRVDLDGGEIFRLQGNQQELNANLRILSEQLEGGIESEVAIFDALEESRRIDGEFGIDIRSFVLLSVLMPDIQDVTGHLSGRIDFEGEIDELVIGGGLEFRDGHAEIPATGLNLRNLNLVILAPSTNEEPFTLEGDVDAGEGQLHIEGAYYLREQRALLNIQGAAFPALNTRELQVTIAPDLQIEYTPDLLRLRGEVTVPSARITPPDFETVDSVSNDTVLIGGEGSPYDQTVGVIPIDMDVTVNLGDDVQVSAFGFEGRLQGGLRIIEQTGQETTAVGNIDVASGAYEIYGQALNIERGRLIFTGGPVANPGLDLRVERNIDNQNVTVGARVGGTLENPTFNLFSSPTMQDSAILSYLLFGRGPGEGSSGEQNMLARATLALGMSGGNRLGERLSDTLGVDEISLDSGDTFESTALYIGKQLSSRLYIKYGVGLVEPVSTFFIQYRLTDNLNFESRTGNEHSGADLFYTIER